MGVVFFVLFSLEAGDLVSEGRENAFLEASQSACDEAVRAVRKELEGGAVLDDRVRVLWSY